MAMLDSSIGMLLLVAVAPALIAVRLGKVLERASGLGAMQIGLAAWLIAAAIAQLSPGDERWLAHALAIAVPATYWIGARQWRDIARPWAIPAAAAGALAIADLSLLAYSGASVAIRSALAAAVVLHAGAAGGLAVGDLLREGLARSRSQRWCLLLASVLPPLFAAVQAALTEELAPALDPLTFLPLTACLGWILKTQSAGISEALNLGEPMIFVDGRSRVADGNEAAFALLSMPRRSPRLLHSTLVGIPGLRRLLEDPSCECGEFFTGASADTRRCYEARVIRRQGDEPWQRVIAIQDVTARRESERQLLHQARFDSLTGLANRRYFLIWLETALAAAHSSGSSLAVMYIDLDRFKSINDTYGHGAGDELLRIIAQRLRQRLRSSSALGLADPSLARLGGDEFALLLPQITSAADATGVATWLLDVLAEPVMVDGKKIWNAGSVGIAIYPDHGEDVDSLLRAADIALYHAKKHRRGSYQVYDLTLTESTQRRASVDRQLRGAIESNTLAIHYQPKFDMRTRKLKGAEALLRWHDAELGAVAPKEFVPVAEESGLIRQLGDWVLETVCTDLERWRAEGRTILPISINVSSRQFAEADMSRVIADALSGHDLDPHWLEIELTESSILENDERTAACLREIRAIGVRVSLDDFGTGYSSLSYLNRVPLDVLKIDHSFVRDIHLDPGAEGVVSAVVSMAHSLGLEVVAEGADCDEQVQVLEKIGCDAVQGFVFAPALPEREYAGLLMRAVPAQGSEDALLPAMLPAPRTGAAQPAPPVSADPRDQARVLVIDDGTARLGVLAMRLNRLGATAIYASDPDEALLFSAEQGPPIRALVMRSDVEVAGLRLLVDRVAAKSDRAPALLFVGDDVAKPLLDLRSRCRIWSLRDPIRDEPLRDVTREALYGTPLGAAQRQHPRVALDLMASVTVGDQSEAALLSSLSLHGAFLELAKRPPAGTGVDVAFLIEDVAIRARATVVHHVAPSGDAPGGIGVRFHGLSPASSEAIETLIEQRSVRCLS